MKILFIGHSYDYLQNDMLHGLRGLYGADVVDYPKIDTAYKTYPVEKKAILHGQGFGIGCTLDDIDIDRTDIEKKIADKFFDLVVIGQVPSINHVYDVMYGATIDKNQYVAYHDTFNQVFAAYEDTPKRVIVTDGADGTDVTPAMDGAFYFKRELIYEPTEWLRPITFGFPKEKICSSVSIEKTKVFSDSRPDKLGTGLYNERDFRYIAVNGTEADYYGDYQKSLFGVTLKKAGWDCQRHYEIIFNHCLPFFLDIEQCPPWTLVMWPKDVLREIKNIQGVRYPDGTIDEIPKSELQRYINIEGQLFDYASKMFTTEAVARYVVEVATS